MAKVLGNPWIRAAILVAVALILRCDTFGDPNLDDDDTFYQAVGIAMHHGALPYVDIWDRKPFGLFAIYWLIAGISAAPIAYQLAAGLFAAATAAVIAAIGARWGKPAGGLLAGLCYLLWLAPTQGYGGQTPLFYNLFIAGAALLVIRARPELKRGALSRGTILAMLLAGCAITVKTTALFEALFLGLYAAWRLFGSPRPLAVRLRNFAICAAVGAAPTLLIAAAYWAGGHGPEFWHAMVTSNLSKAPPAPFAMSVRALIMAAYLTPLLILALFGLMERCGAQQHFAALWLTAALVGLVSVPRFYMHYALPLLVPLCVAAIPFLDKRGLGLAATAVVASVSIWLAPPLQFAATGRSKAAIERLAEAVRRSSSDGPLMIYDGPPGLYHLTGHGLVTPLTFYAHLSDLAERDVSHLSTLAETQRVLALRPGAVVIANPIRSAPINAETYRLVLGYIHANCRLAAQEKAYERMNSYPVEVWGDCRSRS